MGEGAVVDGIGNALYGEIAFQDGVPNKMNFDTYRMIRMREAPKSIAIHFVENQEDPTGLGEPFFHLYLLHWRMRSIKQRANAFMISHSGLS